LHFWNAPLIESDILFLQDVGATAIEVGVTSGIVVGEELKCSKGFHGDETRESLMRREFQILGGLGVASSNLAAPTNKNQIFSLDFRGRCFPANELGKRPILRHQLAAASLKGL
jgi:hypothetical protein